MNQLGLEAPLDEKSFDDINRQLSLDPLDLFTDGGCHVFAVALVTTFGYRLRLIPGREPGWVSHIYCVSDTAPDYAIDVSGHSKADRLVRQWGGDPATVMDITVRDLVKMFRADPHPGPGLFAHRVFWNPACDQAGARIAEHWSCYDGTQKCKTPDALKRISLLEPLVHRDARFTNITLQILAGAGGSLLLAGEVVSDRDLEDLKQIVETSKPPVETVYSVRVISEELRQELEKAQNEWKERDAALKRGGG